MLSRKIPYRFALSIAAAMVLSISLAVTPSMADMKIGSLMSMTGDLGAYGPPIQNGVILAAKDINDLGGVLGEKVEVVSRDTQTNPQAGVDAAKKLVELDKVVGIIGALSSGVSIPVATSVSIPSKVIQISPASTSEKITDLKDNDFMFRTVAMDALQAPALASVCREQGFNSVSVIYVNNDYGEGLAKGFSSAFLKKGGTVSAMIPYNKGQASYRSEAEKAIRAKPDAIVMVAYPQFGAMIMRQAIELGYKGQFAHADGMKGPEVIENVGSQYVENNHGTVAGNPIPELTQWFAGHYQEQFGEMPPKPYIDTAYDAAVLMALAAAKGGKIDAVTIRDNIRAVANPPGEKIDARNLKTAFESVRAGKDIDYEGVSGPINFDDNGDVPGSFEVWKFSGGKIETVKFIDDMGRMIGR